MSNRRVVVKLHVLTRYAELEQLDSLYSFPMSPACGAPPQTLLRPRLDLLGEGRPHLGFGKAWRTSLECCRVTAGQRGGHLRNSTSRRGILARNCSESRGKRSDRPKCSHIRESMKPDPHSGDSRHAGFPFPSGTPAADTLRHVEFGASQCCATRNRIRTSRDQHLTIGEARRYRTLAPSSSHR